jgi:hypothetical protein
VKRLPPITRVWAPILAAALCLSSARSAGAADKAAAESLFRAGKELMAQERYPEACEKFAESMEAEPSVGAQLNHALCREKQGKLASAWGLYRDAAAMAGALNDARRQRGAESLAEKIEPRVSMLTVVVRERPTGLTVTRSGEEVVAFSTELPTDPGTYRIEATAPGHATWSTTVTIGAEADRQTVEVPALTPEPSSIDPSASPSGPLPMWQSVTGWSLIGVGAVGLTVGTVFGVLATGDANELESTCGADKTCPQDRLDDLDGAKTKANVSTAMLVVGAATGAAGAVLLLLDPIGGGQEAAQLIPSAGPGGAGLTVTGRF